MVIDNSSLEIKINCVFVETSIDTRLVVMLNNDANVSLFKEKLRKEHSQCFPDAGDITISAVKVEWNGHFYHLPDSMNVSKALDSNSDKGWFLFVDAAVIVDNGKLIAAPDSNLNPDELLEKKTQVLQAEAAEEKIARKRKRKTRRKKSSHKSLKLCEKVEVEIDPESGAVGNDIEIGDKDIVNIGESQQLCPNPDEVLEKKAETEETWEAAEEKTKKRKVKSSDAKERDNSDGSHKSCEHVKVEVATESGAIAKDFESLEEDGTSIGMDQKTSEVEMLVIEDSVE